MSCIAIGPRELSGLELAAPDAKSILQEWAQGRHLPLPRYIEVAREGPDHEPRFTSEVQIEALQPGAWARREQARGRAGGGARACCCARAYGQAPQHD